MENLEELFNFSKGMDFMRVNTTDKGYVFIRMDKVMDMRITVGWLTVRFVTGESQRYGIEPSEAQHILETMGI